MEKITALINEIQDCTLEIEVHYPELYNSLDETTYKELFSGVSTETLHDYLNKLKVALKNFKKPKCHESRERI
ncbi:hypothetical protein [Lacinutrix sp. MEBiC02404]